MNRFESAPKWASATRFLRADFISRMPSGTAISSAAVLQSVYTGAASAVTIGSPAIDGTKVSALISGGTPGVIYQIIFQATLSDGSSPRLSTMLAVVPDDV